MRGIVVFLKTFCGTKSESVQPFLYLGRGETVRIHKEGDNPFENTSLLPFDGKEVVIEGEMRPNDVLQIDAISEVDALQPITADLDHPNGPDVPTEV